MPTPLEHGTTVTIAPFATQALTPVNHDVGGVTRPPQGMVLHIAQGTYQGTIGWEHNPAAQVSSYFVVGPEGQITQLVDLANKAWTESNGNDHWIGVEFAGFVPQALTPAQVEAAAQILVWLHAVYLVPIQATDDPVNGHGLGWHGMGGASWGGHFGCPGPAIVAQRPQILARALALANPKDIVMPQYAPALNLEPIVSSLDDRHNGGSWLLAASGAIYAFGTARGVRGSNGKAYFAGKKGARLEYPTAAEAAAGKLLAIITSDTSRYALPTTLA